MFRCRIKNWFHKEDRGFDAWLGCPMLSDILHTAYKCDEFFKYVILFPINIF
jgi:hypothetical protein